MDIFSGPDIFSIVEANYLIGSNFSFKDYNLEYSRIHPLSNISRTVLLIRDNISYIRRYDLESPLISSIWVEINISRGNKLLVCAYYRQWSLNSNLNFKNSNSIKSQIDRYQTFCNQVERACQKGN